MTRPIPSAEVETLLSLADGDTLRKLALLLDRVMVNQATGDLTLKAGAAQITLSEDGTVRVTGARIVQDVDRDVSIRAAWIDLN
ncbi:hypothetical protein V8J82_00030 [Gymnodinialimonas sp. 2305UL16-5]|uniref:hypothetical protein n=1 Tax=Gymnodinialimonas mytili TaxID=3126503 RepID=UPI0030B5163C